MTSETKTPKKKPQNIKQFTKSFWALSRPRQEAFLKNLYELSSENKALFKLRLGDDKSAVLTDLIKDIEKETLNRIGRYRKLRLSKINEILRNADKYALPILDQIKLKRAVWTGMLDFVVSKKYLPDRYQVATARHLDKYLQMVNHHVLEKSERDEILEREKEYIMKYIEAGYYVPAIEDTYMKYFV